MSDRYSLLWLFRTISLVLTLGAGMNAFGLDGVSWKEEVLLHDGQKLIAERLQTYEGYSEPSSRGRQLVEEVWEFTIPGTKQRVIWKNDFGKTPENSSLMLLMLDFLKGIPYLAARPAGCISYNKWERPNPPYVFFKFDGKVWLQISLNEFPAEFINANVTVGRPDLENRSGTLSIAKIKEENQYLESYIRTISRTPIDLFGVCPEPTGPDGLPIKGGFKAPYPVNPSNAADGKK